MIGSKRCPYLRLRPNGPMRALPAYLRTCRGIPRCQAARRAPGFPLSCYASLREPAEGQGSPCTAPQDIQSGSSVPPARHPDICSSAPPLDTARYIMFDPLNTSEEEHTGGSALWIMAPPTASLAMACSVLGSQGWWWFTGSML